METDHACNEQYFGEILLGFVEDSSSLFITVSLTTCNFEQKVEWTKKNTNILAT